MDFKKYLIGGIIGATLALSGQALAGVWEPNPLFSSIPTDKLGAPTVPYTQEQKDFSNLYGKLDGMSEHLKSISDLTEKTFKQCARLY